MESDYNERLKSLAPDDFWGQIKRTVNGRPVSEEQILMIVAAIKAALQFQPDDRLLDLACGNGALSRYVFDDCIEFYGVDYSAGLIEVAKRYFEQVPQRNFEVAEVGAYITSETRPQRFTKVLCYGSFAYFPEATARQVLTTLCSDYSNVQRVFIGNLPDLDLASVFYTDGLDHTAELKDYNSKIGIWRSASEFCQLAADCGWDADIQRMPAEFYSAHYRFDAVLQRRA